MSYDNMQDLLRQARREGTLAIANMRTAVEAVLQADVDPWIIEAAEDAYYQAQKVYWLVCDLGDEVASNGSD